MVHKLKRTQRRRRVAFSISLIYTLVAGLWVYTSDTLLLALFGANSRQLSVLQTYKGWFFIGVTALLLYALVSGALSPSTPASSATTTAANAPGGDAAPSWRGGRVPLLIFLLLTAAIGGTGYLVYRHQKTLLLDDKQGELLAIADSKVAQIASWLAERRHNANVVARDPLLAHAAAAWFQAGAPAGAGADLLRARLAGIQEAHGYAALTLLDKDSQVRLSVGEICDGPDLRVLSQQTLTSGQVRVSDLHRHEPNGSIEMNLLAPLGLDASDHSPPVGVVCFKIDPHRYLFPLIQTWPTTPSLSAETLLVRLEGDQVVYLNELRHRKNAALQLRLPVTSPDLPAAMAARGWAGIFAGVDYRQVNVLAALRPVPDTAWFLIAKIDADEVYAPTRQIAKLLAVLVGLFIGGAGLGVWLWWRRQHARFAAAHQRGELERQTLIQHFDYLAKYANDIILLTNAEGQLVEVNDRAVAAYGYAREELLQLNLRNLCHPDTWAQLNEHIQQIGHTNGLVYETWHLRKDKSRFPVEISSRLMPVDHQPFVQNIIRDITQRRRTEAALRESEARFRTFMDNNPVLAFIKDETGRYLYGNRAWITLFDKPLIELIGKTDYELLPAGVAAVFRAGDAAVSRDGKHYEHIESSPGPDGQLRWWTVIKFPITSPTGRRLLGGLALDISARKQAEEQARQRQAELSHLSRLSIMGEMASGLAHELSQPLTAIANYCDAALRMIHAGSKPAATLTQAVERAHRQAQRAGEIIRHLREFVRKGSTEKTPVDVNALIKDTVEFLAAETRLSSIALTLDLADSLPLLWMDRIQIEQVLVNLLHNSIEAMRLTPRARRRLTISTQLPVAGKVRVTVKDAGPGLDNETIQRIFDRFQTSKLKGTGLGLSISRSIIEAHGGSLCAEVSQEGAIFHFTLLVAEEENV